MANGTAELIWLQNLLFEHGMHSTSLPVLWCDDIGAIYVSSNPVFHACTKHIKLDFYFVREQVASNKLQIRFISIDDQIANLFTKPLPSAQFIFLRSKLRLLPRPA